MRISGKGALSGTSTKGHYAATWKLPFFLPLFVSLFIYAPCVFLPFFRAVCIHYCKISGADLLKLNRPRKYFFFKKISRHIRFYIPEPIFYVYVFLNFIYGESTAPNLVLVINNDPLVVTEVIDVGQLWLSCP